MKRSSNFTLVEIIAVLLVIAILAAVAAPKFVSIADQAREGVAQAGVNEAKASLSVAYAKAYLADIKNGGDGAVNSAEVFTATGFTSPVTFGDVSVAFNTSNETQITLIGTYDSKTANGNWNVPVQ